MDRQSMTRRGWLGASGLVMASAAPLAASGAEPATRPASEPTTARFDIRRYGAVGDGKTVNTAAIQQAIDACSAAGGGRVVFDGGRYVTGTIYLKSNVILTIEVGSALLGSPVIADYTTDTHRNMYAGEPHMDRCLIFARDAENIGLEGRGTIDGQGKSFPNAGDTRRNRPMMIRFLRCRNIVVRDLFLSAPAAWTTAFLYCSDIVVDGVRIVSRANVNGDGLDFDGCQNVVVSNSTFDNSDDSICLQGSLVEYPTRNIVITNCVMTSRWAAIRIGLLSHGDFQDITVSNCVFHDMTGEALKIQMTEGGRMENLLFSNIIMRNVPRPVFITFNSFPMRIDSPREPRPLQSLRNLVFSDMRIESTIKVNGPQHSFIFITGLPGHPVENVSFNNIHFTAPGTGTKEHADKRVIAEFTNVRPESREIAPALPSYGFYAHHVKGLVVNNMTLEAATPDARPALICDDVENVRLSGLRVSGMEGIDHLIRLQHTLGAFVTGCEAVTPCRAFVRVDGETSAGIGLVSNDLRRATLATEAGAEVAKTAVTLAANLGPASRGGR